MGDTARPLSLLQLLLFISTTFAEQDFKVGSCIPTIILFIFFLSYVLYLFIIVETNKRRYIPSILHDLENIFLIKGVVDESPATARALELAANAALSALNMTGVGEVEPAAVEPGEPLALPARLCQQVFTFRNHSHYLYYSICLFQM